MLLLLTLWGPPSRKLAHFLLLCCSTKKKYCRINKKREKSTLSASFHVIFSWIFRYAGRKYCSIFWQSFQPDVFAVFFCNEMEFWHIFDSFQRGIITFGRMDLNWPSLLIICNGWLNSMLFQVSDRRIGYILNKSENVTPELFAIYMQNDASQ